MKKIIGLSLLMFIGSILAHGISPYIQVASLAEDMNSARELVKSNLEENGYEIIGSYQPGKNSDLYVMVFTNDEIKEMCKEAKGRGMLAAALKVGFQKKDGRINVSIVNPEYLYYAYFTDRMDENSIKSSALSVSSGIKTAMKGVGTMNRSFGGDLSVKELKKYRYMMGMPNFDDPVKLDEFGSFQQGVTTIRKNLAAGKGNTVKVYEIVDDDAGVAVFGVGLLDKEEGEAHFLPIIGEDHVAAMPYEIILFNNKATMLHGRYRFASHWPELTMKTFTKIMSSPGDVEDAMKGLVE